VRLERLCPAAAAVIVACHSAPSPGTTSSATLSTATLPPPSGAASATAEPDLEFDYVEVMTGGARLDEREPMVVALHGLGDRPESFVGLFDGFATAARVIAPHSETAYYDGYSWFEFRRSDPDFSAPGIAATAERLARFLTAVARRRPTLGKPIVVGFSQGGALSFALAALHPGVVGGAFPLSGWFPRTIWPAAKADGAPPIVAFHGTADTMVPITRMRLGATRLSELGYSVDVREFDGVGHAIPPPVRAALFEGLAKACERARTEP
jgi:phospholipase/carboxylesterase